MAHASEGIFPLVEESKALKGFLYIYVGIEVELHGATMCVFIWEFAWRGRHRIVIG